MTASSDAVTAAQAKRIGLAVKRRRKELGLSLDSVGERTGLRWTTLGNLEDGDPATPLGALIRVCAALDLAVALAEGPDRA